MAAHLSLVVEAAQRDADVFSAHGLGNALAQRGLADARRTVEAEDGGLQVATEAEHGHVLQDALLHLLHAVVVAVEDALRTLQVKAVLGIYAPRQRDERLQVVEQDTVVGRLGIDIVELGELLGKELAHLIGPGLEEGLLLELPLVLRLAAVAQLLADVLDLLVEEVLLLLLVDVGARLVLDVLLDVQELGFAVEDLQQLEQSQLHVVLLQQHDLVVNVADNVGGDEIDDGEVVADVLQGDHRLVGDVIVHLHIDLDALAQAFHGRGKLLVVFCGEDLRDHLRLGGEEVVGVVERLEAAARRGDHDGRMLIVGSGHLKLLDELGIDAHFEEVLLDGVVHAGVFLCEHGKGLVGMIAEVIQQLQTRLAPDENRGHDAGEGDQIAGDEDGDGTIHGTDFLGQRRGVAVVVRQHHPYRCILLHYLIVFCVLACKGTKKIPISWKNPCETLTLPAQCGIRLAARQAMGWLQARATGWPRAGQDPQGRRWAQSKV